MSEPQREKRTSVLAPVGWCLMISAGLLYGGCWLWYSNVQSQVEEREFKVKIENQRRYYSRGGTSPISDNTLRGNEHFVREVMRQYTPWVISAAVLGSLLVGAAYYATLFVWLTNPGRAVSDVDWRLVVGIILTVTGAVGLILGYEISSRATAKVTTARGKDRLDLESRTMRNVHSPYGGSMTVTHGSGKPTLTMQAEADLAANKPIARLLLALGGLTFAVGLLGTVYAQMHKPRKPAIERSRALPDKIEFGVQPHGTTDDPV